jgi:hypothetical protein
MIRNREQPLNPPGIDAPDRKIKRQYIPMREYDDIEANGYHFSTLAEVEACGKHDEDLQASLGTIYLVGASSAKHLVFIKFLESYISPTGPTWRELIEREICRQAALFPCTAWEVEYEGD